MAALLVVMLSGFPLGFLVSSYIIIFLVWLGFGSPEARALDYIVGWLISASIGYLQWFVLVPWPWRKWKAWRVKHAGPTV